MEGGSPIAAQPPIKRHPYDQWSPDARALDLVGDKWTLLIVRDLAGGPRRFVELQRTLPGISTEQLRSRLNRMVADDLLTRQRYREVPPRVDYELTERARALLPVIGELARWGYQWAWGPPRPGENVDVGAILRAAMPATASSKQCAELFQSYLPFSVSIRSQSGQSKTHLAPSQASWSSCFSTGSSCLSAIQWHETPHREPSICSERRGWSLPMHSSPL